MKKNKLYTVNKWNRPSFMPEMNLFDTGGTTTSGADKKFLGMNGSEWGQLGMQAGIALGSNVRTGDPRGAWDTMDPVYHLAGGRESRAGNAMSDAGVSLAKTGNPWLMLAGAGLKVVGGLTNAAFGVKEDKATIGAANNSILANKNFTYSNSFDTLDNPAALINTAGAYEGGWFSGGKADRKNEALTASMLNSQDWAERAYNNNVNNLVSNQYGDYMRRYAAYGGPLNFGTGALGIMQNDKYIDAINQRSNAIAKTNTTVSPFVTKPQSTMFGLGGRVFDFGGLQAQFLDNFGSDPIGAAVRYNQGMEQLAAQEEEREAEAAREAEYAEMQKRLAGLETQNQGLQALLSASPSAAVPYMEMPSALVEPEPTATTSQPAAHNGTLLDFIKGHEGFSSKAYWLDGEDAPTIGYGFHTIYPGTSRRVRMGDKISREEGDKYLLAAINGISNDLSAKVPNWDKLAQHQKDALIDLAYATGTNGRHFKGNSKLMTALRNEDWEDAANQLVARSASLPVYNKRLLETSRLRQNMFRNADYSTRAFGGELGTNGTDFTNGLLQVNAGGTHESNVLGGVPMGVDEQGVPNLVEEGETVYNNYVFSNRLDVPQSMYRELGLGGTLKKHHTKNKGISFADASKKLALESEQRPNDPISQAGLEASLAKLAEVQEAERAKENMREDVGLESGAEPQPTEKALGGRIGNKFPDGGRRNPVTHLNTYKYDPIDKFKYWNTEAGNYDAGYRNFIEKTLNEDWIQRVMKGQYGDMSRYKGANSAIPSVEQARYYGLDQKNSDWHKAMAAAYDDYLQGVDPRTGLNTDFKGITTIEKPTVGTGLSQDIMDKYVKPVINGTSRNPGDGNNPPTYDTWMRYAPVAGAGLMALTDVLGLTNSPDYTYANKLEVMANRAGYAPDIQPRFIGDYMRYNPFDRNYWTNQLAANTRATDRALLNSISPSRAAGLLASGYNTTLGLGNLARQGEEYNLAQREKVADFNRKTNMFNSQMGLEADIANARYRQQAAQMGLSGLAQAAALRDQIDARVGAARSANITNLLNNLGNIGRENFAMNQINTDRSRRYYGDLSGNVGGYKGTKRSRGGKLNRK